MTEDHITKNAWLELSALITRIEIEHETRLRETHGRFNIFTTLLKASDEVRLHTRFLHELLNPNGTHDCGDLFLKLFFQTLENQSPVSHENEQQPFEASEWNHSDWKIWKEFRTNSGQLDLLLECASGTLVIENKIYHHEGERQIARYSEYLASRPQKQKLLLFLTLTGDQASSHENHAYLRISYAKHILHWLNLCLRETYSSPCINQILIQYQAVVQHLTGNDLTTQDMAPITDFLRTNPTLITQIPKLEAAVETLRQEVMIDFMAELEKAFAQDFHVSKRPGMQAPHEEQVPGIILQPKVDDFTENQPFEIWIEVNNHDALFIGLEAKWWKQENLTAEMLQVLAKAKSLIGERSERQSLHYATIEETWKSTYWPVGGRDLKSPPFKYDPDFFSNLQSSAREGLIAQILADAQDYLKLLGECLADAQKEVSDDQFS